MQGKKRREDEDMYEQEEIYDALLESISSYYGAIGNPKRLKILLALEEQFIDGMKWPELRELVNLSSGALKRHIDVLLEVGLIGKSKSNYRISKAGLGLLAQVEEVNDSLKEILRNKKEIEKVLNL